MGPGTISARRESDFDDVALDALGDGELGGVERDVVGCEAEERPSQPRRFRPLSGGRWTAASQVS